MVTKRLPVPVTFLVVIASVVFLMIFFSAWAVSADSDGKGRALSFGFGGGATASNTTALNSGQIGPDGETSEDSWWGGALLKACPFH